MAKKARSAETHFQVGPRIVRAWFDTVINPLLHSLEMERELLGKKNWTWRFQPPALEALRSVRAHIGPEASDNLEQLVEYDPALRAMTEEHDTNTALLYKQCKGLHDAIQKSPRLREIYREVTSEEALSQMGATMTDLFGAYPPKNHLALLAQYIANHTDDLPGYYSTARLWNPHREKFMAVLDHPSVRKSRDGTLKAGKALLRSVECLIREFKKLRLQLSSKHDVPLFDPAKRQGESTGEAFG